MGRAAPPENPCSLFLPLQFQVELLLCFQQRPCSLHLPRTHLLCCVQVSSSSWQRNSLAAPCPAVPSPVPIPCAQLCVWGTFTGPFSCLPRLPGPTTIKSCMHRVRTDACHFKSVSPAFRSQTGSFPQPLMLSQELHSALRRVRDGLGYAGNSGGSWRLSIWHSLEQDSK